MLISQAWFGIGWIILLGHLRWNAHLDRMGIFGWGIRFLSQKDVNAAMKSALDLRTAHQDRDFLQAICVPALFAGHKGILNSFFAALHMDSCMWISVFRKQKVIVRLQVRYPKDRGKQVGVVANNSLFIFGIRRNVTWYWARFRHLLLRRHVAGFHRQTTRSRSETDRNLENAGSQSQSFLDPVWLGRACFAQSSSTGQSSPIFCDISGSWIREAANAIHKLEKLGESHSVISYMKLTILFWVWISICILLEKRSLWLSTVSILTMLMHQGR